MVAYFGPTAAANADFRVCNDTENLVGAAIGYRASEGWVTEGWWQIPAASCATLIEGPLQSRYYYVYAEDAVRGGRWAGDIGMCVADNEFKIVGVENCVARGYQRMDFEEYDTGRQGSWMVQLSDVPTPAADNPASNGASAPAPAPADDTINDADDDTGSETDDDSSAEESTNQ